MAFWDNWFKVPCQECGEKFAKEELLDYHERKVCSDCQDSLEEARVIHEREVEERRMAEEKARAALLDRPIETSGKPFGAAPVTGGGDSGVF